MTDARRLVLARCPNCNRQHEFISAAQADRMKAAGSCKRCAPETRPLLASSAGVWMQCEVCGTPIHRVQINERGNGTGPWQESRSHLAADGSVHIWRQEHNCQDPQPDACTFCAQPKASEGGRDERA